jgi:hypothetical protein
MTPPGLRRFVEGWLIDPLAGGCQRGRARGVVAVLSLHVVGQFWVCGEACGPYRCRGCVEAPLIAKLGKITPSERMSKDPGNSHTAFQELLKLQCGEVDRLDYSGVAAGTVANATQSLDRIVSSWCHRYSTKHAEWLDMAVVVLDRLAECGDRSRKVARFCECHS